METINSYKTAVINAEYSDPGITEYQGNPFIEALPPLLGQEEVIQQLMVYPEYHESERNLDATYRYHCVQRLFRYFQPLDKHLEIERRFSRIIRQGYIARNPFDRNYALQLQNNYHALKQGNGFVSAPDIRNTASGFFIVGISGIGKTTAIERTLSMYPQVISHTKYQNNIFTQLQLTWLKLDCPYDGSLKGLCLNFFREVDEKLGTSYSKISGFTKQSIDNMMQQMAQISHSHGIGTLIIDEIQHLSLAKSGGSEKMLNFFVTLVNTIGVPVVLIGTMKAMSVLQGDFRQARRGTGQGDLIWERMNNDTMWRILMEGMWEYQWTKNHIPFTDELNATLYEESQGIVDLAIKLYVMAQLKAIATKKETIDSKLIRQVSKESLKLVQPMVNALKSGDIAEIAKYEDIRPFDITPYFEKHLSDVKHQEAILTFKENEKQKRKKNKQSQMQEAVVKLIEMGIESRKAKLAIDTVSENYKEIPPLFSLIQDALNFIQNDSTPKEIEKEIYDANDLRLLLNDSESKEDMYKFLKEANIILSTESIDEVFL